MCSYTAPDVFVSPGHLGDGFSLLPGTSPSKRRCRISAIFIRRNFSSRPSWDRHPKFFTRTDSPLPCLAPGQMYERKVGNYNHAPGLWAHLPAPQPGVCDLRRLRDAGTGSTAPRPSIRDASYLPLCCVSTFPVGRMCPLAPLLRRDISRRSNVAA